MTRWVPIALGVALQIAAADVSHAQSIWLARDGKNTLQFEALHVSMERFDEDFSTGIVYLSGRFVLGRTVALVMELPHIRMDASYENSFDDRYTLRGDAVEIRTSESSSVRPGPSSSPS
jgi:hypothetical protein